MPGKFINCKIKPLTTMENKEALTVTWLNDMNNQYTKLRKVIDQDCLNLTIITRDLTCISFSKPITNMSSRKYYLIISFFSTKLKLSWEDAAELCEKRFGGYLPWFKDKESLDEILAFFKLSSDIPPIEAIYIGLKTTGAKVSES